ncbi:MYXO-CTERM sorting domain-containing protein [Pelomonas aquatica]|jgi:uncharacterized protein (TIGR03382 family)|uniref:PEP-CTERM protein-sorting domain-containing protein n=1 Tax=Pelomonas aquatica TaxID=431058 RepID=A0A9X4R9T4_9BURK|nr:MYXO-CTERM sorting domain-containing protein [Pelomonas aquatica]MCY4753478.1 hypothetical protein [Pelomonas aquatica]MDG0864733.1 hypothetical protein [Pelomonas aquatica]
MSFLDKLLSRALPLAAALSLASGTASAALVSTFDAFVAAGDAVQHGRIARNQVPQDWAGGEAFGGVVNPGVAYRYHTYDLDLTSLEGKVSSYYGGFVQVSFDSLSLNTFLAAYLDSYDPTSAATMASTWLGDPGTSGNYFGTDPLFFQVYVPQNSHLLLVLNDTSAAGAGVNQHGTVTVEAFQNANFGELPEPGSMALCFGALVSAGAVGRRRRG